MADLTSATWRKSSRSNGNNGACVEVAHLTAAVGVRDSKNQAGPVLAFGNQDWTMFLGDIKGDR